jgi:hypothetical protein
MKLWNEQGFEKLRGYTTGSFSIRAQLRDNENCSRIAECRNGNSGEGNGRGLT